MDIESIVVCTSTVFAVHDDNKRGMKPIGNVNKQMIPVSVTG
jgi:hypothetical protein